MMKYIVTFLFLFSFSMLLGIQKRKNNDLLSFVVQDLETSPMDYRSYLIIKTKDIPFLSLHFKDGYWVGPFYEELTEDFSSYCFPKENIYKVRDIKNIFVYDKNVNNNGGAFYFYVVRDSIPIVNAEDIKDTMFIEKDPFINYIKRARLYRQIGDSVYINYHPDTLVMPRIVHDELIQE